MYFLQHPSYRSAYPVVGHGLLCSSSLSHNHARCLSAKRRTWRLIERCELRIASMTVGPKIGRGRSEG